VAENGRAIDLSGGEAIAAENRLSFGTQELIVVATQPVQLALEAATTGLRYTAIATGIALTAALAAALFFTIRVVRPVEKMAETAREIAAGDLSRRIEVKNLDEIGDLAAAINHLTSELGEVIGTLEQRVSDRTEDLEKAAVRQSALIEDLEAKNVEMALVQQQLEQLVQSKDEFLASVSHELRTPLASVVGFAAELRDHYVDFDLPEQLELIGMIAAQGQDMADIINDLLVAARAETGSLIVESTPVDLKAEVETVLSQLPEATVGFEAADAEIVVVADPVRVRQVLRNLVVNALRYGGPQVEINVSEAGEVATLQVRDNGAGIPNEDWEIIFDPYRRAHDRKGQPASVGLGLTVSRMLANRMQGDLSYRYDQGESVFELVLPVEDQRKPKRHEKHSSSVLPSGPTL
jgi:signal transduction histidine kinase